MLQDCNVYESMAACARRRGVSSTVCGELVGEGPSWEL